MEDETPLMQSHDNLSMSGNISDVSLTNSYATSTDTYSQDGKDFADDKFVWDRVELETLNKQRELSERIPVVYREYTKHAEFGIRANPNMDRSTCLKSLITPTHNEFVAIWLSIIFAIYFWVQLIMVTFRTKSY